MHIMKASEAKALEMASNLMYIQCVGDAFSIAGWRRACLLVSGLWVVGWGRAVRFILAAVGWWCAGDHGLWVVVGLHRCALAIEVALRIPTEENHEQFSERLLELDAAIDVMDTHDKKDVETEKQSAKSRKADRKTFRIEYAQKRKEAKFGGVPPLKKLKKTPTKLPFTIEQGEAKKYIPGGSYIWRGRVRAEWWGHLSPFKRIRCPFTTAGEEQEACRECIRGLWKQHAHFKGYPFSECPIEGVYVPAAGGPAGGAGSSSDAAAIVST